MRIRVVTRLFGNLRETLEVPLTGTGSGANVHFVPSLLFPGLQGSERLSRHMSLPARATLFAADGTPLAQGPDRSSPIADVAGQIAGVLGPIPAEDAAGYAAQGYPPDAKVGQDGLERAFQTQLAGTPGGSLLAGHRILAHVAPKPGNDVTTTIVPAIERAAIDALGGRLRRHGRHGPAHRRAARAGRHRVLGRSAARLDHEDHHLHGALDAGIVKLRHRVPVQHAGGARRLHAPQRRRRGLRRHAAERVRGLVQLGVRPARRAGRRKAAPGHGRPLRLQPDADDPRRRRELDPAGEPAAATSKSAPRRSARARSWPPRSR